MATAAPVAKEFTFTWEGKDKSGKTIRGEIRAAGGRVEALHANVGIPSEIENMIKFAVEKFGQLDILHNNAIRLYTGRVGEMTLENWRKTVDLGLTAYWYATRCALEVMVPRGRGVIVNPGSVSAGPYALVAVNGGVEIRFDGVESTVS